MEVIKQKVKIPNNRHLEIDLPESIPVGDAEIMVLYEPVSNVISLKRKLGLHRGLIKISDDFDKPLPNSFWLGQ